jgi:hypothetical protein
MGLTCAAIIAACMIAAAPAAGQDGASDAFIQSATDAQVIIGTSRIDAHRIRQAQQRRQGKAADGLTPNARATCLNKARAASNLGANHPDVRRLYALCAQAGY